MIRIKIIFFAALSASAFLLAAPSARGAVVLKTQGSKALIHLEGMRVSRGSYFEVLDMYGERKGIVRVKRAGKKKAIVSLKSGRAVKGWSLEPVSKKQAKAQIKKGSGKLKKISRQARLRKLAKKRRQARLEKQKLRKKARERKRRRLARRQAAEARAYRKLASVDAGREEEEYIISDEKWRGSPADEVPGPDDQSLESEGGGSSFPFAAGLQPVGGFDMMSVKKGERKMSLSGLGYGGRFFFSVPVNDFLTVEPQLGYRKFSVSAKECEERGGCSLSIDYASAGVDLKLYLTGDFWAGARGILMYPLAYENKGVLKEESFEGLHGALGLSLGYDITKGNMLIPVSFYGGLFMPQSKTVGFYTTGFSAGIGYQF